MTGRVRNDSPFFFGFFGAFFGAFNPNPPIPLANLAKEDIGSPLLSRWRYPDGVIPMALSRWRENG
jgi:hypothetical protein